MNPLINKHISDQKNEWKINMNRKRRRSQIKMGYKGEENEKNAHMLKRTPCRAADKMAALTRKHDSNQYSYFRFPWARLYYSENSPFIQPLVYLSRTFFFFLPCIFDLLIAQMLALTRLGFYRH